MTERNAVDREAVAEFCRRHGIRKLSLFGSVLRDDFGPESDVDVLVEFDPGRRIGLIGLSSLEIELSGLLGRKVDLRTPGELSPTSGSRCSNRRSHYIDRSGPASVG